MGTVVIATDGSEESKRIIAPAGHLAKAIGAEVVLVRVADSDGGAAEAELNELLEARGLAGRSAVVSAAPGDIVAAVVECAASEDATLLAVGARGRGRLRESLMGSVTTGVLSGSSCPVMVGGSHIEERTPGAPYHVLVTTDGSQAGDAAAARVASLAPADGTLRVTLLRAYAPVADAELDASDRKKIADELRQLASDWPPAISVAERVQAVGPGKKLSDAIIDAAAEEAADAIWMGSHGHSRRARVLAGSTALGVVEKSRLPVVLVRA